MMLEKVDRQHGHHYPHTPGKAALRIAPGYGAGKLPLPGRIEGQVCVTHTGADE